MVYQLPSSMEQFGLCIWVALGGLSHFENVKQNVKLYYSAMTTIGGAMLLGVNYPCVKGFQMVYRLPDCYASLGHGGRLKKSR